MTQTKHENRQTMETKDTCFCEESFIDRSFLVLEILIPNIDKIYLYAKDPNEAKYQFLINKRESTG